MQENSFKRAETHRPTVIEVSGEPQGVVVPADGGFRFLAVKLPAFVVDGQHFPTIELAHQAVRDAVQSGPQL
ncbi:hypothetical protein VW35_14255 [Devosia soli]|uniref:Uncharacterized protein n=1 Tax=Devosia soli TaxID=361041 RepID=A0A0F5L628_9HYPH|nr:hypothetical protein [Devosia soli]KKB77813.1 hypothetical protein VW35_14255 [Devosia soli]